MSPSPCRGTALAKGNPFSLIPPLNGAPTMACLCQGARALGHRPLLGSLHPLRHSLHSRVTSLPLNTVPPTASRQPRGQRDRRSAARPPQGCRRGRAAAPHGTQPTQAPLRASPDLAARADARLRAPPWPSQSPRGVRVAARDPTNQPPAS